MRPLIFRGRFGLARSHPKKRSSQLIPRMDSVFPRKNSLPRPGNPRRSITASSSTRRNMRGFGFPFCGRGVTVPTTMCPKPRAASPRRASASLSIPRQARWDFEIQPEGLNGFRRSRKQSGPAAASVMAGTNPQSVWCSA